MRQIRLALTASVVAASLAAGGGVAEARAPEIVPSAIVINKSIGGAKLGMKRTPAIKAWEFEGSNCEPGDGDDFCFWDDKQSLSSLRFTNNRLRSITIGADKGKKGGFVREFKLDAGVGIGSTRSQVRAYFKQFKPKGKILKGKRSDGVVSPNGSTSTSFIYTGNRLTTIQISRVSK